MKRFVFYMLFISNLIFSLEIKTAAQESKPKFFYKPNGKEITGICIDIMREIERIEPDIKFSGDQTFLPLKRIEEEVKNGNLDCFVGFIKNQEREKNYIYIDIPIYYVRDVLISRKNDNLKINKMEDIKKIDDNLILMVLGVGQTSKLKILGYNIDDGGKSLEANLEKLLQGRGRFMYQSEIEVMQTIEEMGVKGDVKIQLFSTEKSGRYIAFSKKTPKEKIEKVKKALEKLRDNGKLDEIFKKYVGNL